MPLITSPTRYAESWALRTLGWSPADHGPGILGWTFDPLNANAVGPTLTSQKTYAAAVLVTQPGIPNTVYFIVNTLGATFTSAFAAVYDESGALIAQSADISSQLTSTGLKTITVTGIGTGLAGNSGWGPGRLVYVAVFQNATTPAKLQCAGLSTAVAAAANLANGTRFLETTGTGTSPPNPFGANVTSANVMWAALGIV